MLSGVFLTVYKAGIPFCQQSKVLQLLRGNDPHSAVLEFRRPITAIIKKANRIPAML